MIIENILFKIDKNTMYNEKYIYIHLKQMLKILK